MAAVMQAHSLKAANGQTLDAIPSYGTKLQVRTSADGVEPKTFLDVFGVGDIDGPSVKVDEIETTSHSTGVPIKTFVASLIDPGELGFPCFWNPRDPTQSPLSPFSLESLIYSRKTTDWRLITPDEGHTTREFRGFLKEMSEAYPVQGVCTRKVSIRVTGQIVYVFAAVTLLPTNAAPTQAGGAATVAVTSPGDGFWYPMSLTDWITVNSPTVPTQGDGNVNYTVAANSTGASRVGAIVIGDQSFEITQAGV